LSVANFCLPFADSKRINRALFGAYYEEDIYDRACGALPLLARALWWRMPAAMRRRKLIFVHVPRAAGTSVVRALYGSGCIRHVSMRYYRAVHPRLAAQAQSFALLRDPIDRFLSAYNFVRRGGTPSCRLSDAFAAQTAHIASVDDYLSFLEGRRPLDLDFVMRPQSWFVCDRDGAVLVKRLFLYGEDQVQLAAFLRAYGVPRSTSPPARSFASSCCMPRISPLSKRCARRGPLSSAWNPGPRPSASPRNSISRLFPFCPRDILWVASGF
jgi:hypothetical protein